MKLFLKSLLWSLLLAPLGFSADVLPDTHKPTSWAPGVGSGVTGGIPSGSWSVVDMTTLGFTTSNDGATNAAALTAAISTYNNTDTVLYIPNGTYPMNAITVPRANRLEIRGQDMFQTKISQSSGERFISWGSAPGYGDAVFNPTGTVTSGFTRGSTTIVVQDNGNGNAFRANEFLFCKIENDSTIPVITYRTYETGLLDHMNYVTAVTNNGGGSWTLTLYRPVGYDYVGEVTVDQPQVAGNTGSRKIGITNLTIDCNSIPKSYGISWETSMVDSWIKDVRIINADNYPIVINQSLMCSIVGNFVGASIGWGSSHAGIAVYANCNGILVEDNIIERNAAGIIVQSTANSAISHNLIVDSATPITTNHAAFPHHNAYEGNIASFISSDGTHGGSGTTVIHRNWFFATTPPTTGESAWVSTWNTTTGLPTNHSATFGATLKRWTYKYSILRNVFGVPGYTEPNQGVLSLNGQPNMSNGFSVGYGSYGGALATLTTRTGDGEGVITAPADHGITTGSTIDVYWGALLEGYPESFLRRGMTVGTVSGTLIPVSGGTGDVLPSASAEIYVPTANAAIRTYPRDWDGTNWRPQRWTATVDSVDIPTSIVATITSGDVSVAQARVAEGIAEYFWFDNVAPFNFGRQILTASAMSGSVITFDYDLAGWGEGNYPTVGQTLTLDCDSWGNQQLDLDVKRTAIVRGNKTYLGTAVKDALGVGETTPSSYIYGETAPGFLTGYAFPVFDVDSVGTLSVRRLPAGDRYMTFLENGNFDSDTVATPQFSPAPGTHAAGTEVSISGSTSGATYYYTLNGDTPTSSSTLYTGSIPLSTGTTVLKAIGVKAELTDSAVQTGSYTLVTAPTAPSGLGATATSSSQVNLAWTDNSSTETGFRIERRIGVGSWSTVTTTAANATSYSNTGLTAATTYEYRVYAINVAGDSAASNTASATTNSEGGGGGPANATVNQLTIDTLIIP